MITKIYETHCSILKDVNNSNSKVLVVFDNYHKAKLNYYLDRSSFIDLGGIFKQTNMEWTFPSGSTVMYGYVDSKNNVDRYAGLQFSKVIFHYGSDFSQENSVELARREFPYILEKS